MKNEDLIYAVSKTSRSKYLKDNRECIHINESCVLFQILRFVTLLSIFALFNEAEGNNINETVRIELVYSTVVSGMQQELPPFQAFREATGWPRPGGDHGCKPTEILPGLWTAHYVSFSTFFYHYQGHH